MKEKNFHHHISLLFLYMQNKKQISNKIINKIAFKSIFIHIRNNTTTTWSQDPILPNGRYKQIIKSCYSLIILNTDNNETHRSSIKHRLH